ncbi:MAG TPA: DUF3634 family protein [Polyangiaceae bacterium]
MMLLLFALAFALLAMPLVLALVRANELFFLHVRRGRVSVRRGRIPQRLLDDISDVVRTVESATLRGVIEGGRPRLYAEGELRDDERQRLRNIVGTWSTAQIRNAPRPRRRS